MTSSAKKNYMTPKVWKHLESSLISDDFTVETNDEAQISLWKDKICSAEHFKWLDFFCWIKDESGVFDT